jgi:hypothetical protein
VLEGAPPLGCDCAAGGCAAGLAVEPPLGCDCAAGLAVEPPLAPAALGPDSLLAAVSLFGASELLGADASGFAGSVVVLPLTAALLDEPGAAGGGVAALDEDEAPGAGVVAVPPMDAEPDDEPGAVDGEELGGVALLELEEPGVEDVLLASRSQAASPKAIATAIVRVESFMGPPWLGYERKQQYARPD